MIYRSISDGAPYIMNGNKPTCLRAHKWRWSTTITTVRDNIQYHKVLNYHKALGRSSASRYWRSGGFFHRWDYLHAEKNWKLKQVILIMCGHCSLFILIKSCSIGIWKFIWLGTIRRMYRNILQYIKCIQDNAGNCSHSSAFYRASGEMISIKYHTKNTIASEVNLL